MSKNNVRFAYISVVLIPVFYFIFYSLRGEVFGYDSKYFINYLFSSYHSFLIANLFAVAVWFATLFSFTFVEKKRQKPLFFGSLYLLNLFNIRLLMPDPDNWIFLLSGMFLILYFKNNPIKKLKLNNMTIGLFTIFCYLFYRGFVFVNTRGNFTDMIPNYWVFFFLLPTYYILIKSRRHILLILLLVSIFFFPSGKFTTNAIPLFIYSIYIDFMTSERLNLEHDKIIRFFILAGLISFLFAPFIGIN